MSRNERRRQEREEQEDRRVYLHQLEASARGVGRALAKALAKDFDGKRVGFMLMLFEFDRREEDGPGFATYFSNAERESMIKAMQELIWRLKEQQQD